MSLQRLVLAALASFAVACLLSLMGPQAPDSSPEAVPSPSVAAPGDA